MNFDFGKPYPVIFYKAEKTEETMNTFFAIQIDNFPVEQFKIINFEDIKPNRYFISTYGRIFTIFGQEIFPAEYISKENNAIYYRIELVCTGRIKQRKFFIHRLVANAFIPKTDEDIFLNRNYVNHKYNMDGRCNYVWNLEWTNAGENTKHALANRDLIEQRNTELNPLRLNNPYSQYGEENYNSRLTDQQVELICIALSNGKSILEAAIFAGLEGNDKDMILIRSIKNGYTRNDISIKYGILPKKQKHNKSSRYRY